MHANYKKLHISKERNKIMISMKFPLNLKLFSNFGKDYTFRTFKNYFLNNGMHNFS